MRRGARGRGPTVPSRRAAARWKFAAAAPGAPDGLLAGGLHVPGVVVLVEDAFAFLGKALLGLVVGHPRRILVVEVAADALQGAGGALEGLRDG